NWRGFTKMLSTTWSARCFARSTRCRCPWCRNPIVGTNAMRRPRARSARDQERISFGFASSCMAGVALLGLEHDGVGEIGIIEMRHLTRRLVRDRKQPRRERLAKLGGEGRHVGDQGRQPVRP